MSNKRTTPERLVTFSDAVFAVIITIMVLDLKPPAEPTLKALLPLWPTALSYAVSYLFIAIIWVNHHHLLRFAHEATSQLIWRNFAHLFMVSLVPRNHCLDGGNETGRCSRLCLCLGFCPGRDRIHRFRTSCAFSGKRQRDHSSAATNHEDSFLSGAWHVHCRNRLLLLVSFDRARLGL
jgi:hypothetical protein